MLCSNVNRILISSTGIECCVPVTGVKVTANQKHDVMSFTLNQDKKNRKLKLHIVTFNAQFSLGNSLC